MDKTSRPYLKLRRPEFAAPSMCSRVDMGGLMLIHIRRGDKNTASTKQLAVSALRSRLIPYLQASYTAIVTVFGVLRGSI